MECKAGSTKSLLANVSTVCVNPVYVMLTGKKELNAMQDDGLLENSNLRVNQACSLLPSSVPIVTIVPVTVYAELTCADNHRFPSLVPKWYSSLLV